MLAALLCAAAARLAMGEPGHEDPDLVRLTDGRSIECRVLLEDSTHVVCRVGAKVQEVARADVAEVQSIERSLAKFLERFASADTQSVSALSELALFAEKNYLPGEAWNTWLRVLTVDPENEQAWTKLGGIKRRKGWELKVRGRFLDIAELRTRTSDWKNALELRTAHFQIETDALPELALDASLDLERSYQTFYSVFGAPLGLYVFDEVPEVQIFADAKDYPAPPVPGRQAWYSRTANALYVNAQETPRRGEVVAELVDALIFNSFRRTLEKRTGEIEPWAREGLRQAFAGAVRPDPGRATFEFETPLPEFFRAQAADPKPLALEQVLRAGAASFDSGSERERLSIGAYTLTHFLVFADSGKYRPRFAEFLRSSYLGKSGSANFLKGMGVEEAALETEWQAYVKANAGS